MGVSHSPAELAAKFHRAAAGLEPVVKKANIAVARASKAIMLTGYVGARGFRPSWVRDDINGDEVLIRLKGGFAYLREKGSYKKPHGWEIKPRRRGRKAIRTPEGPRAHAHHPPIKAHPAWERGAHEIAPIVQRTYQAAVVAELSTFF